MPATLMRLKVLVPFQVFSDTADVKRIVADTTAGSFGILPRRLDCVAALVAGILVYETKRDGECFLAVDEGVLIKTGAEVSVSVRRAVSGTDLEQLQAAVERDFRSLNERQQIVRTLTAKMETGLIRRLAALHHE
ncbi:MAG: atpC [Phycisphaerales bacterium]|nr:atpC [Phycisphaerales bacterium]